MKELLDIWQSESQAANDCIVEILESYMEFIDIFEKTIICYLSWIINAIFKLMKLEMKVDVVQFTQL